MDAMRFDALSLRLAKRLSRRSGIGLFGLLGLGLVEPTDAKKKKKKKACPPCKTLKKGKCKGTLPDGTACPEGSCQAGACIATPASPPASPPVAPPASPLPCPNSTVRCGANCVDTTSDVANCGICGIACAAGQTCQGGGCTCDGVQCAGCCDGTTCRAGTSDQKCGKNGAVCQTCSSNEICENGSCICVPDCAERECGNNGCSGSCGTCQGNDVCQNGTCICVPDCGGKECGNDGCDGSCGSCQGNETCEGGTCVCQPDCGGKACGEDGCGGSCGSCQNNESCQGGTCICIPDCNGKECGNDGCGNSCGTCPGNETCEGGTCVCVTDCDSTACNVVGAACGNTAICECRLDKNSVQTCANVTIPPNGITFVPCQANVNCGAGQVCDGVASLCVSTCTSSPPAASCQNLGLPCGNTAVCQCRLDKNSVQTCENIAVPPNGINFLPCQANINCGPGQVCDAAASLCVNLCTN